ncbi:class I SAM-dependent methyltransferase [Streptomyces cacaoi]|uniref:class I SAM-dependent methyltransferase n=1 Tax=Streptomyces cacaoi TaxID=1898 RepID=UPI002633F709|nr:class I SAM-dependent methyltransferase [Streptomyces cacaoi]
MDTSSAQSWDAMYDSREQVFSGAPNPVLVGEASDLPPGQALDVGCGEGADALWLARRGWLVTAVDVSRTALRRAAAAGGALADRVCWAQADLLAAPPPAGAFDLVSVHYFPLPVRPGHGPLRGLLDAVAPGGTLLFATHDLTGLSPDPERGFDPGAYYQAHDIAALLDPAWEIVVDETRPRPAPGPAGTRHTHDTVLRARRPD